MRVTCEISIAPDAFYRQWESVRPAAAREAERRAREHVPYDTGALMGSAQVAPDGSTITYTAPYAAYQYYGVSRSGRPLRYQGAPKRGARWMDKIVW